MWPICMSTYLHYKLGLYSLDNNTSSSAEMLCRLNHHHHHHDGTNSELDEIEIDDSPLKRRDVRAVSLSVYHYIIHITFIKNLQLEGSLYWTTTTTAIRPSTIISSQQARYKSFVVGRRVSVIILELDGSSYVIWLCVCSL